MNKNRSTIDFIILSIAISFFTISLFVLNDYGAVIDSQKNFLEGSNNLNFLLTGKSNIDTTFTQMHGAIFFILAELTYRIFTLQLNLLNHVSSHHLLLPIFTTIFFVNFYFFTKKHLGETIALITTIVFITYPYYFGQTFNNIKDVPLLIFFSLAIFSFVDWFILKESKYLNNFFIFLGIALSIKIYAITIFLILFLWILTENSENKTFFKKSFVSNYFIRGAFICLIFFSIFYMPALWGTENKTGLLNYWFKTISWLSFRNKAEWSTYSFTQVFYRTPLLMLIFFLIGVVTLLKKKDKTSLDKLFLIWLLVPIAIPCFPRVISYNGMRHFLVFLIPFSIITAFGLIYITNLSSQFFKLKNKYLTIFALVTLFIFNLKGVAETHPYETTFFNHLAGGLGGAQKNNIPQAYDYWLNSYKEAEIWLDKNANRNANIIALYDSGTEDKYNTDLIKNCIKRTDLKTKRVLYLKDSESIPNNTYVLFVPIPYVRHEKRILESDQFKLVYKITRQQGEILSVYYKS